MTRMTRTYRPALPDGRLAEPTRLNAHGRRVIDIDSYVPYFLIAVNNALSRGASARYLREFGVGVTEWRVLSWLATEPGIPASRICEVIALDKAAEAAKKETPKKRKAKMPAALADDLPEEPDDAEFE